MAGRLLTGAALAALLTGALLLTSCRSDPDLWARYRIERALWRAQGMLERVRLRATARPDELAVDAIRMLDDIGWDFPAATWANPQALRRGVAADVARLAGTAALLRASFDESAGRDKMAELALERIGRDYAAVDVIAIEAAAARARCLERLGREAEAVTVRARPLSHGVWVDASTAGVHPAMPRLAVDALRLLDRLDRHDEAERLRDELLRALASERDRWRGRGPDADLAVAVASLEAGAGRPATARAVLREALTDTLSQIRRGEIVLDLARRGREEHVPDTVSVYASWAAAEFPAAAPDATLELARAWDEAGVADSALAVYKRVIDSMPRTGEWAPTARYERAALLERLGHWESARSEFRALASLYPTHARGLDALVAIMRHHVKEGESDLARIEGRHAIDDLDRMLALQRDPAVQRRASVARAEALALLGKPREATDAYAALWDRYPGTPEGDWGGWRAIVLADSALGDAVSADRRAAQVATRARNVDVRRWARARMSAIARRNSP